MVWILLLLFAKRDIIEMLDNEKGIIWFSDVSGQVFKGRLVDYDHDKKKFWARATRECPSLVDVVIILKDGGVFPSGKIEWCGRTRLITKEKITSNLEGFYLLCLEAWG